MKKLSAIVLGLIISLALTGCGNQSMSLRLGEAQKIIVYSISGKKVEITDAKIIQKLTDNITSIQFNRDKSSENMNGFGPIIQWYNSNGELLDVISIMDEKTIDYANYYWITNGEKIDTSLVYEILDSVG